MCRSGLAVLLASLLKRTKLAGAHIGLHLFQKCHSCAAWSEVAFDFDVPCGLIALGQPGRQRRLLVFGEMLDCLLNLGQFHRSPF
ncbi:MAG: hypothetical protein SGI92_11335 [Bryobacteraceae bacterium]|nr:hypothetical protein [Bryobacteraceae bacterium]